MLGWCQEVGPFATLVMGERTYAEITGGRSCSTTARVTALVNFERESRLWVCLHGRGMKNTRELGAQITSAVALEAFCLTMGGFFQIFVVCFLVIFLPVTGRRAATPLTGGGKCGISVASVKCAGSSGSRALCSKPFILARD